MIRSYPNKTRIRKEKLQEYVRSKLISPSGAFICSDYAGCCRPSREGFYFHEGQMSHLGRHYDLEIDGRPTRIVIMGVHYGQPRECVDLEERREMISERAQQGFSERNPHMAGVTSTLRLLLGRELGTDEEGEKLMQNAHIFDGFALVNYLLCSALKEPRDPSQKGGGKAHSSSAMRRNCSRHLKKTLEILDPTLIVVHGLGVRDWMLKNQLLAHGKSPGEMQVNKNRVDVLIFTHPSAGGKYGYWGRASKFSIFDRNRSTSNQSSSSQARNPCGFFKLGHESG